LGAVHAQWHSNHYERYKEMTELTPWCVKHWRGKLSEFEVAAFWFVVGVVLMTISWGLTK